MGLFSGSRRKAGLSKKSTYLATNCPCTPARVSSNFVGANDKSGATATRLACGHPAYPSQLLCLLFLGLWFFFSFLCFFPFLLFHFHSDSTRKKQPLGFLVVSCNFLRAMMSTFILPTVAHPEAIQWRDALVTQTAAAAARPCGSFSCSQPCLNFPWLYGLILARLRLENSLRCVGVPLYGSTPGQHPGPFRGRTAGQTADSPGANISRGRMTSLV